MRRIDSWRLTLGCVKGTCDHNYVVTRAIALPLRPRTRGLYAVHLIPDSEFTPEFIRAFLRGITQGIIPVSTLNEYPTRREALRALVDV